MIYTQENIAYLTNYCPVFSFYIHWKYQKTYGFWLFSEGQYWVKYKYQKVLKKVPVLPSVCFSEASWSLLT